MDIQELLAECRSAILNGNNIIVLVMPGRGRVGHSIRLYGQEGGPKGRIIDEVEDGRLAVEFNPAKIVVDMMLRAGRETGGDS